MSRASKITLGLATGFCVFTVWGVHYMQWAERESMYQGVLKDEARLAAKRKQQEREAEFQENLRKRAMYEAVQKVESSSPPALQ
ncbi:hypothetical protein M407DRAFT_30381 [Tulasnella calospora MUT 4182]|uniref:Cytochrome c oxidase assembly protein n=1 Tax=Tulasnella calospora MUT 4182 TaxID=1051891 RepID=A0A0C3L3K1_9AGAM|nr:hypothetical protein M407DRAFT_247022 [Tulasnella calospora MUT 4182]KIO19982.1 hypothetical protein M407DRAFT_30381 [Tulasnella calospora MUT 4182]